VLDGLELVRIWSFDKDGDALGWAAAEHIAPLEVRGGALLVRNVGPDPQFVGPALDADASNYQFLALRCRSSAAGETQIYFSKVGDEVFREEQGLSVPMKGDGEWHTYQVDLRPLREWSGMLRRLRIDPVNGKAEVGARLEIDWIGLYSVPTWVPPLLPWWKDEHTLVLGFENRGGSVPPGPIDLRWNGRDIGQLPCLDDPGRVETEIDARALPRRFWIEAWIAGARIWRGRLVKPAAPESAGSAQTPAIAIGSGAAVLSRGERMHVRLAPVASLTLRGPGHALSYYEFDVAAEAPEAAGTPRVYREYLDDPQLCGILCTSSVLGTDVRTTIEASAPLSVLRFEGPRMLELRPHSHALFPGLEYLGPGEESSQSASTGAEAADRTTPDPTKITAPMIAVEYDRDGPAPSAWVAALLWDIANRGKVSPGPPAGEFRSLRQGHSYATAFLPPLGSHVDENTRLAARSYTLPALERLELVSRFRIEPGTLEDVFAEYWTKGLPEPPGLAWAEPGERERAGPGSRAALEHILATSMLAYTQTLYDVTAGGWKTHIAIGEAHRPHPEFAAAVLAESLRSGRAEYAAAIGLKPDAQLEQLIDTAAVLVQGTARAKARDALLALRADGSVAYETTPELERTIRDFTARFGTGRADLGQRDSTESGLIALAIRPLLEYAACTRDPVSVAACERALARLNQFRVPRGAQAWEIHIHTPDLYAAAQCVLANLWGWRIFGDEHSLDEALRWARTGLPFLYFWEPPGGRRVESVDVFNEAGEGPIQALRDPARFYADTQRQVAPFASIPAFGTSWYAVTWLGTPVQWCGLAWANAVRELDAVRAVPELVRIADGVFRSAANQQCDQGYLAGTLPDSWQLATGYSRQPYIVPDRILEYACRALDVPSSGTLQYLRLPGPRWTHVAGRALLAPAARAGAGLAFDARFFAGQQTSLIVGGTAGAPSAVRVDGRALESGNGLGQQRWIEWDSGRGALLLRWVASGGPQRIEIDD
jgi:hypothetical protein